MSVGVVLGYGVVSTLATGLGAVPFFFTSKNKQNGESELSVLTLALGNAMAAGLMIGASLLMASEGMVDPRAFAWGVAGGVVFVAASRAVLSFLDLDENSVLLLDTSSPSTTSTTSTVTSSTSPPAPVDPVGSSTGVHLGPLAGKMSQSTSAIPRVTPPWGGPGSAGSSSQPELGRGGGSAWMGEPLGSASRVLLFVLVFTLHSFTEGIGLGVSFGGSSGLGPFMSIAIAVHNIPEGLAIALVMVQQGQSPSAALGWSILSSAPQAVMAVPAWLFVDVFSSVLPLGLGLAAGAMVAMVLMELIPEIREQLDDIRCHNEEGGGGAQRGGGWAPFAVVVIVLLSLLGTFAFHHLFHPH